VDIWVDEQRLLERRFADQEMQVMLNARAQIADPSDRDGKRLN
jgi:hypothetical protein